MIENIKQKLNSKKEIIIYTIIAIIFFGRLYNLEYATDTYEVFNFSGKEIFYQFASNGRFITALIGVFIKQFNISEELIYLGSYILASLCIILSQYKLYQIIKKDVKNRFWQVIIPIIIIINPFLIELFLFIEKGIMVFSILASIYAIQNIIKYFENKNKKNLIYSFIFMIIANFSYQGTVGIFVSIAVIYILKYSKNIKQFITNNLITVLIYGIPALIDYIIVKFLYSASRINGEINIIESLQKIYENTIQMIIETYNILPKYLYISIIVFTFWILCYKICKEKHKKLLEILKIIYIIVVIIGISILPQFLQQTSQIWFVPRSTYSFASLYGILLLYLFAKFDLGKGLQTIFAVLSILLLMFELYKFQIIEIDRYKVNYLDYQISRQIVEMIDEYETYTNIEIKKIAICEDKSLKYTHNNIFATKDINIKSYFADWSTKAIIEYYTGKELEQIELEEIKNSFLNKNWDEFSKEQIILKEDVLIVCRY